MNDTSASFQNGLNPLFFIIRIRTGREITKWSPSLCEHSYGFLQRLSAPSLWASMAGGAGGRRKINIWYGRKSGRDRGVTLLGSYNGVMEGLCHFVYPFIWLPVYVFVCVCGWISECAHNFTQGQSRIPFPSLRLNPTASEARPLEPSSVSLCRPLSVSPRLLIPRQLSSPLHLYTHKYIYTLVHAYIHIFICPSVNQHVCLSVSIY